MLDCFALYASRAQADNILLTEEARQHIIDVVALHNAGHDFDSGLRPMEAVLSTHESASEGLFTLDCLNRSRLG